MWNIMDIFFIYSVKENVKYSIKLFICGIKRIAGIPHGTTNFCQIRFSLWTMKNGERSNKEHD